MRRPRYIPPPGLTLEVTARTVQSRLLLRPSKETNDLILGVLGRAPERHPRIALHAFVFLSNHFHLILTTPDARELANFMCFLQGNIARSTKWVAPLLLHARVLAGEPVRGHRIRIAQPTGDVPAPVGAPDVGAALDAAPDGALKVFLYHYPDEIEDVSRHGADLYLAGHTHGGQVALPFYGALVTFSRFGKKYESGLYRLGPTALYVNRGIGMEGGSVPRVRFLARPEITLMEIVPLRSTDDAGQPPQSSSPP